MSQPQTPLYSILARELIDEHRITADMLWDEYLALQTAEGGYTRVHLPEFDPSMIVWRVVVHKAESMSLRDCHQLSASAMGLDGRYCRPPKDLYRQPLFRRTHSSDELTRRIAATVLMAAIKEHFPEPKVRTEYVPYTPPRQTAH